MIHDANCRTRCEPYYKTSISDTGMEEAVIEIAEEGVDNQRCEGLF